MPAAAFRTWRAADAPALVEAWIDSEIARWNPVPATPDLPTASAWIATVEAQQVDDHDARTLDVVWAGDDGSVRGEVGLRIDRAHHRAEIGFWVAASRRREGTGRHMLEAVPELLATAGVSVAFALIDSENVPAVALVRAVGWPEVETTSARRAFAVRSRPTR